MSMFRGENINIGVGVENPSARGTKVAPVAWIPGRTPSGLNVELVKSLLKETRGGGVMSRGSEVVQSRASGSLEFNVRTESLPYLLKSLMGKLTTTPVAAHSGSYDHLVEVEPYNPQFPTLTLALSQGTEQAYACRNALVRSLEIKTPVNDLVNGKAEFLAVQEEEHADYTVSPSATDFALRPFDVTIKFADTVSGLAGAQAIALKEFTLNIANNARFQQTIGAASANPTDVIADILEVSGNVVLDYLDATYHDAFRDGEYRAMEVTMVRTDQKINSDAAMHPTITITLDKVSLEEYTPDRPMDDVVRDSFKFVAHYSEDDSEALNIVVRNGVTDYAYEAAS